MSDQISVLIMGDQIPVLHLTPKWSEEIMVDPRTEILCVARKGLDGHLSVLLRIGTSNISFPARVGEPDGDFTPEGRCLKIRCWGLQRLGPGVWKVTPSISESRLHAYLVLCDVPEPAPFVKEDGSNE